MASERFAAHLKQIFYDSDRPSDDLDVDYNSDVDPE